MQRSWRNVHCTLQRQHAGKHRHFRCTDSHASQSRDYHQNKLLTYESGVPARPRRVRARKHADLPVDGAAAVPEEKQRSFNAKGECRNLAMSPLQRASYAAVSIHVQFVRPLNSQAAPPRLHALYGTAAKHMCITCCFHIGYTQRLRDCDVSGP